MKDFLKDKEKENFEKAPKMPEDIKELYQQRQREMSEQRSAEIAQTRLKSGDERTTLPAVFSEPNLEQITLPPPAGASGASDGGGDASGPKRAEPVVPNRGDDDTPPPAAPATRPREVENKKKGKKGTDDPE
jgi:hypothetical protein